LTLLACSTPLLCAGPTKPKAPAKSPSHAGQSKPGLARKQTTTHSGVRSALASVTSSHSASLNRQSVNLQKASSRTARGRRARTTRVVYGPPPPSYQLHPDADRYLEIQKALADRGYFKGELNGDWGDDSVDALKRFQLDQKLPDDGKISALTLIGLGLGPKHDGAATLPVASPVALASPAASLPIGGSPPPTAAAPAVRAGATPSGLGSHRP
jgi:hypothetical protein